MAQVDLLIHSAIKHSDIENMQRIMDPSTVKGTETWWVDLQPLLLRRGYRLRPRYDPNWRPSWLHKEGVSSYECEDSLQAAGNKIDAVRVSDNQRVVLKRVETRFFEIPIAVSMSSQGSRADRRNCSVPVYDVIMIPDTDDYALLVMLGEFVEFVIQVLEGLEYLHDQNIIHRDVCWYNIMMDSSKTVLGGHHFCRWAMEDGVKKPIQWNKRWQVRPNQYYIIDFGLSIRAQSKTSKTSGNFGQDRTVPEMSGKDLYDPFKADIYQLGNVIKRCTKALGQSPLFKLSADFFWYWQLYDGLERFSALADKMTLKDPAARPNAHEAVHICADIVASIKEFEMTQRIWAVDGLTTLEKFLVQWLGWAPLI